MNVKPGSKLRGILICTGIVLLLAAGFVEFPGPAIGSGILLHPLRRKVSVSAPRGCEDVVYSGAGIHLNGWRAAAVGTRRGTLIYLHGFADNRAGSAGTLEYFRNKGFDVIAYDGRAHGSSGGESCTFGVLEKIDLRNVIDTAGDGPVILIGSSLGAAVAIQTAAIDSRVTGVVAAEVFSDLRTVATERAPFFLRGGILERTFRIAERDGGFPIADASPAKAARSIKIPVLLIHGSADSETVPAHSQRVYEALAGRKRIILVPGAGHNESLRGDVWKEIESWIDGVI